MVNLAWKCCQSPEGKRCSGRSDIPQEGNLKDAGPGHYHMPKDKLEEKTDLFEQRALAGTQDKKGSVSPLKEGVGDSEKLQGCHEVI